MLKNYHSESHSISQDWIERNKYIDCLALGIGQTMKYEARAYRQDWKNEKNLKEKLRKQ